MFLADQRRKQQQEPGAQVGRVTLAGMPAGVELAGERRKVSVCAPGGYHWRPELGERVLVVKSGAQGSPCLAGVVEGEDLPPGQVWISVCPGVGVRLTRDGGIVLEGDVEISGTLFVNGQEVTG